MTARTTYFDRRLRPTLVYLARSFMWTGFTFFPVSVGAAELEAADEALRDLLDRPSRRAASDSGPRLTATERQAWRSIIDHSRREHPLDSPTDRDRA